MSNGQTATIIPQSQTGWDWLDGLLNTAIQYQVYQDYVDAQRSQQRILETIQQDQQVGMEPYRYDAPLQQPNTLSVSWPAAISGGAVLLGIGALVLIGIMLARA